MSVNLRGEKWQAYVSVNGVKKRKSFDTKDEAIAWEQAARKAMKTGLTVPTVTGSVKTNAILENLFKRSWAKYWENGKSSKQVSLAIKEIVGFFGTKSTVSEVSTEAVDDFVAMLIRKGNSNGTINRKLSVLSKTLKLGLNYGYIDKMPKIERKRESASRIRWLTKDEEKAILKTMDYFGFEDLKDAFIVSIDVGCRLGELNKITGKDVIKDGVYLTDRKAYNHTVIPLTTRARKVLERRAEYMPERLFTGSAYWYRAGWERVVKHLGLTDVVWHTLRHTTCSRLVQGGMPLTHVKEWMGHKAIQTTMRYAHLSTSHLSLGVDLLQGDDS